MSLVEELHTARKARLMRMGAMLPVQQPAADKSSEKIQELTERLSRSETLADELRGVITRQRAFIQRFADDSEVPIARMNDIIMVVADHYGLTKANLIGDRRPARIVLPRQITFYIGHKLGHSFPVIGRSMDKDHSTAVHGSHKIKDRIESDPEFAAVVSEIEAKISAYVMARIELSQAVLAL